MPKKLRMTRKETFVGIVAILLLVAIIGIPLFMPALFQFQNLSFNNTSSVPVARDTSIVKDSNFKDSKRKALDKGRFTAPIQFSKNSPVIKIPHDDRLNPLEIYSDPDKSSAVRSWAFVAVVRVRHLSGKGSRHIFALKYDAEKSLHPGWGIAFHKMGNDIFPEVYWGTAKKQGAWYRYMPVPVHPGEWWVVGLSFEADRYLVLHAQPLHRKIVVEDLNQRKKSFSSFRGAYDLMDAGRALSKADLMLGTAPGSIFKGGVGFFGVAYIDPTNAEKWFLETTDMIKSMNIQGDLNSRGEAQVLAPPLNSARSRDFEFILGSFDGISDIVTNKKIVNIGGS